jgi:hypothetical protein
MKVPEMHLHTAFAKLQILIHAPVSRLKKEKFLAVMARWISDQLLGPSGFKYI